MSVKVIGKHEKDSRACRDALACLGGGVPVPLAGSGHPGHVHSALKEEACLVRYLAGFVRELGKGILQPVIHLRKHAGAKLCGEQFAGEFHVPVNGKVGCRVEDLHVAPGAAHPHDFGHELLVAQHGVPDFVLRHGSGKCDRDHVPVYCDYLSCC